MNIGDALSSTAMFEPWFHGESWDAWRAVARAAFGVPLSRRELELFRGVADRDPPAGPVKELVIISGRRSGKDSIASAIATHVAASFNPAGLLRPGERAVTLLLAVDRTQADIALGYIRAFFEMIPSLAAMVQRWEQDGLELTNGVDIVVATNDFRRIRGRTVLCAILDEVSYWRDEHSANPDREVYRSIRPGMVTIPSSMMIMLSTAYRRAGLVYTRWQKHYGGDSRDVLVIRAPSIQLNPTIPQSEIDRALADDPEAAKADYFSEWRDDLASYASRDVIERCVDRGVTVRPWRQGVRYVSWFDAGSGYNDSFTCGIAHAERDLVFDDAALEIRAPFDTADAVVRVAAFLRSYKLNETMGDDYAKGFAIAAFRQNNIRVLERPPETDRSALYLSLLPRLISGQVRLRDDERAVLQLAELERRTMPGGHDKVNHPNRAGHHDDLANSIAGACWRAGNNRGPLVIPKEALRRARFGPFTNRSGPHSTRTRVFG
jgi:hypothetical protein